VQRRRRQAALLALAGWLVLLSGCAQAPLVAPHDVRIAAGQAATVPFHADGPVRFAVETGNGAPFGVCLVPDRAVAGGSGPALACHQNVRQAAALVDVGAGDWALALQCAGPDPCDVQVRAFAS